MTADPSGPDPRVDELARHWFGAAFVHVGEAVRTPMRQQASGLLARLDSLRPPAQTAGDVNQRVAELCDGLEALDAKFPGHVRTLIGGVRCDRLLAALTPASPSPFFAMLPITADACRTRAEVLRAIRDRRLPGEDPELYANLTSTISLLNAAAGVDPTPVKSGEAR